MVAAFLGAGKPQVFAEEIEQGGAGIDGKLVRAAVDGEGQGDDGHGPGGCGTGGILDEHAESSGDSAESSGDGAERGEALAAGKIVGGHGFSFRIGKRQSGGLCAAFVRPL